MADIDNDEEDVHADDDDGTDERVNVCPMCNGQGALLGSLGALTWYRCIQCGAEFTGEDNDDDA